MSAENTAPEQQKRVVGRPFQKGQSGNPAGRPKGSRNKLADAFFQALHDDFVRESEKDASLGAKAIEAMRLERPGDYAKMIAGLMAKELDADVKSEIVAQVVFKGLNADG